MGRNCTCLGTNEEIRSNGDQTEVVLILNMSHIHMLETKKKHALLIIITYLFYIQLHEKEFVFRTNGSYNNHCNQVLTHEEHPSKAYGINRRFVLTTVAITMLLWVCHLSHNVFEGVCCNMK